MNTSVSRAGWNPVPTAGTRVLVTGATGGIGRALVSALDALGCRTAGIDLYAEQDQSAPLGKLIRADLSDPDEAARAVQEATAVLGGLDALVGAAGVVDTIHRAASFPPQEFRRDVEANLLAQFYVAQAAYPALRTSPAASIVLFSSVAAQDGLPGQASYAAAKAGVLGLMRTLAAEWAGDGIRVNAVVPGLVATPKVTSMPASARERLLREVPVGRVATLDEAVGTVLYLISNAAGYTTGHALRIDGGQSLNGAGLFR